MTFVDPSLDRVFNTLVNNDNIIDFLKEYGVIITKSKLYDSYTQEQVEGMETEIYASNVSTLYEIAEVLLKFSDVIKSNEIWYLLSNRIAWDELAYAIGTTPAYMNVKIYKEIIFTFKYCYAKSFFQNNRDKFIPEVDLQEIEKNNAAEAFYDAMMKEFDKMDTIISYSLDFDSFDDIPEEYVNYLSQLLGFEQATVDGGDMDILKYRELVKNILDIYRIKGTNYSFELFFNFMGFNIEIKEYWFDRRLYYTTNTAGNPETSQANNGNYEYYLTIHKPSDNEIENLGIAEVVRESDYSPQYSLLEFNELCEKYTAAAVLGYSPTYPIYNDNGDLIGREEYTGKIYKYFKTNVIYYNVSLDKANPTASQLTSITKFLEFLTPSYVMRKLIVETYSEKTEEPIGFDGDGTKPIDPYGNFAGFEMLDSEDWTQHYQDEHIISPGVSPKKSSGKYIGKEEVFEDYKNSLGGTEFRLPLGHRSVAGSVSRFQTYSNKVNFPNYSRVKYYILHTLDGQQTNNWTSENVVITPFYTVPPYVGNTPYKHIKTQWTKPTTTINLLGGDDENGVKDLKTRIRDSKLFTPVDYLTDKTIDEFVNTPEFNELFITETFARKLTKVETIQYGVGTAYDNAYQAFAWEFAQRRYHICNISNDYDSFREDALNKTQKYIGDFYNELYTLNQIDNWYKNDILKNVTFGDYILAYNGDFENGNLFLYRYGYFPMPIKDSSTYITDYPEYLKCINYKVVKDYRGSIGHNVVLPTSYSTKGTFSAIEAAVKVVKDKMDQLAASNNTSAWLDLDSVTKQLYYCSSNGEYYRAIKTPAQNGICNMLQQSFNTLTEAENYFNNNPSKKVVNTEFYVNNDTLYTYKYKNRTKGTLIYSTKDESLYMVCGNSRQDIKEVKHFFGNLILEELTVGEDTYPAYIDAYDEYWAGYDEQADEEDFIFYNSPHKITWDILGYNNTEISRPVKDSTDYDFDANEDRYLEEYDRDNSSLLDFETISGAPTHFKTIGEKIVEEISEKTVNVFTNRELINWLAVDSTGKSGGILSIIEENFEKLTGKHINSEEDENPINNAFDFYSKASDFFRDYYRIVVLGNLTENSVPAEIRRYNNVTDEEIVNCYKKILSDISNELDNITKDRVFYAPVGNWEKIVSSAIVHEGTQTEALQIFPRVGEYKDLMDDPLEYNYGPRSKQYIDGKPFYDEKTVFVSNIANKIEELKRAFGEQINFNVDKGNLGKDSYSLDGNYKFYNSGYTYLFKTINNPRTTISINDKFYLCKDTGYNYFLAYSLNFGLNNYSIDSYNNFRDTYTEFTHLFDLLNRADKEEIDTFLKEYYYRKLTNLYREAAIGDDQYVGINILGRKPFKAYPGLFEKLDGKAGALNNLSTLLSSYKNNGGKKDETCFLKFEKVSISVDENNNSTLKFYVLRKDFIKAFGYDFNLYYQYLDLSTGASQENIADLRKAIDLMVEKQFACIKPLFNFKNKDYYKEHKPLTGLSYFQQYRKNFERDYKTATILSVDKNEKPITNSVGLPITASGNPITSNEQIVSRINETKYLIITINDKDVAKGLENAQQIFKQTSREADNVNGMLVVKKLTQSMRDNFLSIPQSLEWIEKDVENNPTEYTSFGDDRNVSISSRNVYLDNISKPAPSREEFDSEEEYNNALAEYQSNREKIERYLMLPSSNVNHNVQEKNDIADFNNLGQISTTAGYVYFDKTKILKDQGYKINYKSARNKVVKISKNENLKQIKDGDFIINANEIKAYIDIDGNYICEIPTKLLHTSELKKIVLLFYIQFIRTSYSKMLAFASVSNLFRMLIKPLQKTFIAESIIKKPIVARLIYAFLTHTAFGKFAKDKTYVQPGRRIYIKLLTAINKFTKDKTYLHAGKRIYIKKYTSKNIIAKAKTYLHAGKRIYTKIYKARGKFNKRNIYVQLGKRIYTKLITAINKFVKDKTYVQPGKRIYTKLITAINKFTKDKTYLQPGRRAYAIFINIVGKFTKERSFLHIGKRVYAKNKILIGGKEEYEIRTLLKIYKNIDDLLEKIFGVTKDSPDYEEKYNYVLENIGDLQPFAYFFNTVKGYTNKAFAYFAPLEGDDYLSKVLYVRRYIKRFYNLIKYNSKITTSIDKNVVFEKVKNNYSIEYNGDTYYGEDDYTGKFFLLINGSYYDIEDFYKNREMEPFLEEARARSMDIDIMDINLIMNEKTMQALKVPIFEYSDWDDLIKCLINMKLYNPTKVFDFSILRILPTYEAIQKGIYTQEEIEELIGDEITDEMEKQVYIYNYSGIDGYYNFGSYVLDVNRTRLIINNDPIVTLKNLDKIENTIKTVGEYVIKTFTTDTVIKGKKMRVVPTIAGRDIVKIKSDDVKPVNNSGMISRANMNIIGFEVRQHT